VSEDRFQYLRKGDTHLAGEIESLEWLKSVPRVYGKDRAIKDLKTDKESADAAEE
jgi:hypothetical protein